MSAGMSVDTARMLIAVGVVSALAGAVLVAISTRAARIVARCPARAPRRWSGAGRRAAAGALSVSVVLTGVIIGVQWLMLHPDEPPTVAACWC
jgi:hypothetical protein